MYIPMQTMQKYNDALYILHQCDRLDHFVSQTMEQLRNLIPYESGVYFPVNVSSSEFEAPYHVIGYFTTTATIIANTTITELVSTFLTKAVNNGA